MKKIVLIDGHALVHRAFHALPPTLTSSKGVLTNAVFGFTSVLIKMIKDLKPEYIVATFDLAGPTFRHEEFAEYKIHRQKAPDELHAQIPLIQEVLTAFGIPIFVKPGFEADDVIGALSEKAKQNKDLQVVIMTGDLDTLQLVEGDKVVVFTLRKGVTDTVTYNEKEVMARYGLRPDQLIDFKGLKGDPSDNIPGVPGIGEKTASTLIQEYKNLENLYLAIEKQKTKKSILTEKLIQKLTENKEMAFFSKKLATIIKDIDIDFELQSANWANNFNSDKTKSILQDLGFYSLLKRIDEIINVQPSLEIQESPQIDISYKNLKDKKEILKLLNSLKKSKELTFYVSDQSVYLAEDQINYEIKWTLVTNEVKSEWESILSDPDIKKTSYDFKEVQKLLLVKGFRVKGLSFDVKLAAYLLNSDIKDYSLGKLYFNEFNKNFDSTNEQVEFKHYPLVIKELAEHLRPKIKEEKLSEVFNDIELPLSLILAEMELAGIKVDTKSLGEMSKTLEKSTKKLEKEIFDCCGQEFNINSPQQLSHILFDVLGLKGKVKKTSKGSLSTAASELEKLSGEHLAIDLILKYRELQKLKTTYVEPFPNFINKETSRLYTTFNQTGTVTGRLSSQEPNIQNIPIRTELGQEFRKVFIADNGYSLVSFDYSQLELRIAAHISKDEKMTFAFERGEDIHTRTAAEILGVAPQDVTKDMRRQAKVLNFGILYGMGILGFQRASGVSRERAREFIHRYMEEFSGIAEYMSKMRAQARRIGYVETIFGRKRKLPEINSGIPQLVAQAERMAINMPIQGTAADLIKKAMIKISDWINKEDKNSEARMLLQVHDELVFEIKKGKEAAISKKIKDIMENDYKLDVPLVVDVKYGDNWKDMEHLNI